MTLPRPFTALPAFLLAIALQICLPIAMIRAGALFDPGNHATICVAASPDGGTTGDPGVPEDHRHGAQCPLCQIATAVDPVTLSAAPVLPLPPHVLVETLADPAHSAGPRGPPLYAPRARGPPSLSRSLSVAA